MNVFFNFANRTADIHMYTVIKKNVFKLEF